MATKKQKADLTNEEFTVVHNGVETKFKVLLPTLHQQREALKVKNRTFYDAVESGAYLKTQLEDVMRNRNLWNQDKQSAYAMLEQQIIDGQKRLAEGGFKLSEAKQLALEINDWRNELIEMKWPESQLSNETAEGQAENMSFNYLVSACVVYNNTERSGQPVFDGLDDYLNQASTEFGMKSAMCMAALIHGVRSDFAKELPENQFLQEYGFVDEELRLINEKGQLVNKNGDILDDDSFMPQAEETKSKPFLDDSGNEIISTKDSKDKKPPKKTSKKKPVVDQD